MDCQQEIYDDEQDQRDVFGQSSGVDSGLTLKMYTPNYLPALPVRIFTLK